MAIKHDLAVASRFKQFRKKYIDKSGIVAADALGVSQSNISRIEGGQVPVSNRLIKKMITKFSLNRDWLLDNIGNPIKEQVKPKPTPLLLSELMDKLEATTTEIKILNKNQSKLWDLVGLQGKLIEDLRNHLHQK